MAVREPLRLTTEQFQQIAAQPENRERHLELIAGDLIEKPMPKPLHGLIAQLISMLLGRYISQHPIGHVLIEVQYALPDADYAPIPALSVVLHSQGASDLNAAVPFMPALAVEIQSPGQSDKTMYDKAQRYLQHGTQMVWIVYAEKRLIEVLTASERHRLTPELTLEGGEVLPGFSAPAAAAFPAPAP